MLNFWDCIFTNKYRNTWSSIFLFSFSVCLSTLPISLYKAKNKPVHGLLNFRLEEMKIVVGSCDYKSQAEFPEHFSFPSISEYWREHGELYSVGGKCMCWLHCNIKYTLACQFFSCQVCSGEKQWSTRWRWQDSTSPSRPLAVNSLQLLLSQTFSPAL